MQPEKESRSEKKKKEKKKEGKVKKKESAPWNDWSKASFDGDEKRKAKFLSLLGGKKNKKESSDNGNSNTDDAIHNEKKIIREMENQFETSRALNQDRRNGARKGLGAQ
jgi:hypothetical protein